MVDKEYRGFYISHEYQQKTKNFDVEINFDSRKNLENFER